jgi:hypothetical protein
MIYEHHQTVLYSGRVTLPVYYIIVCNTNTPRLLLWQAWFTCLGFLMEWMGIEPTLRRASIPDKNPYCGFCGNRTHLYSPLHPGLLRTSVNSHNFNFGGVRGNEPRICHCSHVFNRCTSNRHVVRTHDRIYLLCYVPQIFIVEYTDHTLYLHWTYR